jgi:hypothetical protein
MFSALDLLFASAGEKPEVSNVSLVVIQHGLFAFQAEMSDIRKIK